MAETQDAQFTERDVESAADRRELHVKVAELEKNHARHVIDDLGKHTEIFESMGRLEVGQRALEKGLDAIVVKKRLIIALIVLCAGGLGAFGWWMMNHAVTDIVNSPQVQHSIRRAMTDVMIEYGVLELGLPKGKRQD